MAEGGPVHDRDVTELPPPAEGDLPIAERIRALDALVGRARFVEVCVDLLDGPDPPSYVPELRDLPGHPADADAPIRDPAVWKDYWVRTWGARGLLHCWHDAATDAVVAGLDDQHYRPAEMCLKGAAAWDVAGSRPGAAALAPHPLPRVRAQAVRTLGFVGDTEHVDAVRAALDDDDEAV